MNSKHGNENFPMESRIVGNHKILDKMTHQGCFHRTFALPLSVVVMTFTPQIKPSEIVNEFLDENLYVVLLM